MSFDSTRLTPSLLFERLRSAIESVALLQPELWTLRAGERAIVGQVFGELVALTWPLGVSVDTEWSREGVAGEMKGGSEDRAIRPTTSGRGSVRPDINVHVRGATGTEFNFMIVEFKLDPLTSSGVDGDVQKVTSQILPHGYLTGAVVSLGGGPCLTQIDCVWLEAPKYEAQTAKLYLPNDAAKGG